MDICNGPYINRQGYAQWSITKFELVDNLYKFGITNNIPLLERKWSLVKQHVPKFSHLNIDRIEELYRLRDLGHNISTIANILGCSTTTVKNYLKKLASA
jgi:DNA-binding NarL/FixJ family response regulator